jgi:anti-sigma factor RsiW
VSRERNTSRFSRGPESQRLSPAERANLVAYIDGELNEAESRAIATKLTQSPVARREVEALERTWELLDYLPRPKVTVDFAQRTCTEVIRLAEQGGRLEDALLSATRKIIQSAPWVAASLVAFLMGYALTLWVWPNLSARLVRELSIAEHLEEYRDVGDFGFLQQLTNSNEFSTERDD